MTLPCSVKDSAVLSFLFLLAFFFSIFTQTMTWDLRSSDAESTPTTSVVLEGAESPSNTLLLSKACPGRQFNFTAKQYLAIVGEIEAPNAHVAPFCQARERFEMVDINTEGEQIDDDHGDNDD